MTNSQSRRNKLNLRASQERVLGLQLLQKHGVTQDIQITLVNLKINPKHYYGTSITLRNLTTCPHPKCYYSYDAGILGHLVRVHNYNPFKCETCGNSFKRKIQLDNHLKNRPNGKAVTCTFPECNYKCHSKEALKNHMYVHSSDRENPYQCALCTYKTSKKNNLTRHQTMHESTRKYQCTICKFATTQSHALKTHMRMHVGEKPFACKLCTWKTNYRGSLKNHMEVHHGNQNDRERNFKCTLCNYSGHTDYLLNLHIRTHTGEKPHKCTFCSYASTQLSNLKTHMRTHTKEKPYKCGLCPYNATTSTSLVSHMRSHTGERPFACKQCKYCTTQSGHLHSHVKLYHTPEGQEKNFRCPLCSDTFHSKRTLEAHMRRHTGEKPYKCRHCHRGSTQAGANKTHERRCTSNKDRLVVKA